MVYEVAIDPTMMNSFDRVARFLDACGSGSPRLIGRLPDGGWQKSVLDACEAAGLGITTQKRIEAMIDVSMKRNRFVSRGRPRQAEPWLTSAIAEHKRLPFRTIVTHASSASPPELLSIEDDLMTYPVWNIPRSVTVERSVRGLVDSLTPLLQLARKIVVVEPNFDIGNNSFKNPIRAMLQASARKPPKLQLVQLHVTQRFQEMRNYWVDYCLDDLKALVPNGVAAEFFIWESDIIRAANPSDRPHDRFLITDNSGVQIGWGFDVRSGSKTTLVLLDEQTRIEIEKDLSIGSNRFRIVGGGPIQVTGTARI